MSNDDGNVIRPPGWRPEWRAPKERKVAPPKPPPAEKKDALTRAREALSVDTRPEPTEAELRRLGKLAIHDVLTGRIEATTALVTAARAALDLQSQGGDEDLTADDWAEVAAYAEQERQKAG